jgi:hypothetical protein
MTCFCFKKKCRNKVVRVINVLFDTVVASCFCRFDTVYLDDDLRVVKDIRGDYLVVDRASYSWKEWVETSLSLFALLHQWKLPTQLLVWFQIFVYFNSIWLSCISSGCAYSLVSCFLYLFKCFLFMLFVLQLQLENAMPIHLTSANIDQINARFFNYIILIPFFYKK